ncbi:MAG: SUMF1/EgtB/PvdO family nonheme iron enzyme [Planctomycetaceae bacterium]|nr:SUMF1/EgtB/PvdO family nonheme iron enzyme [Planctomycetaceae bacterium]
MPQDHANNSEFPLSQRPTNVGAAPDLRGTQPPSDRGRLVDPELIGHGGMGIVWRARDARLNRWVALKRVLPDLAQDATIVQRFLEEARALAQLSHNNIVQVFDLGQDEFGDYIEMEFVAGPSVKDLIRQRTAFTVAEAIKIVGELCIGLSFIHQRGFIHRDIKPGNIMLDQDGRGPLRGPMDGRGPLRGPIDDTQSRHDPTTAQPTILSGRPKLTDFGLALPAGRGTNTRSGQQLGTEGYMAPEQLDDPRNVSPASDQYSLAATLYHMVTGSSPRKIDLRKVPTELLDVLTRALEDNPLDRFPNIDEFRRALDAVQPRLETVRPPTTTNATTSSPTSNSDSNPISNSAPAPAFDSDHSRFLFEARSNADRFHAQAKQAYEEWNDPAVLQALQQVHENLRDRDLEQRARTRLQRTTELADEIAQKVKSLRLEGLRRLVYDYLQLYPKRTDMLALWEQLKRERPDPLVAPVDAPSAKMAQEWWSEYLGQPIEWSNSIGMKFRLIPPGEFMMGAGPGEDGASDDERPQHRVQLTKPFYLGIYPVTQSEYQKLMGTNPSHFTGDVARPVEQVSWHDAQEFLLALNRQESGKTYRLPTEAQWEYACRAGTTTPYWFGNELNGRQANCNGNYPYGTSNKGPYLEKTTPVGKYGANPFGIFDQHGNIWEWCQDWYDAGYYQQFARQVAVDPQGPASGSSRCLRGGSWNNRAVLCRSGFRVNHDPAARHSIGFRVLLELS